MTRLKITIGISEDDLQEDFHDVVYRGADFKWTYLDEETGEDIDVHFVPQSQLDEEEEEKSIDGVPFRYENRDILNFEGEN